MRNVLMSRGVLSAVLSVALAGAAFAGGADCDKGKHANAGKGAHCNIDKKVVKEAKMTEDGAIVTLKGKNAAAVGHIKEHLAAHSNGGSCPGCPLSMEGVTTKVEMTEDGGTLTVVGSSPEAVKAIQEWASKPAGACCKHEEKTEKA
jgi:TusA-related sulfurtransferase